jgi:hypothetical protein
MQALNPSEMLVILVQTARCHISDDCNLHGHHRENIKSSLRIGRLIPGVSKFVPKLISGLWAVPWLRRLVAGLPPRRPGFDPRSVHVGFVVDKVALGQVPTRVVRFFPINFIVPVLHYL